MKNLFIILFLLPIPVFSAKIVTDPTTQQVTHCEWTIDETFITLPVKNDGSCEIDITDISMGKHLVKAKYINSDPIWGEAKSEDSFPFEFTRPSGIVEIVPDGLRIIR